MARGRRSPFAQGPGGKFITMALEIKGMRKAADEMEKAGIASGKLKASTDKVTDATKKNTKATDDNTKSNNKNKQSQESNITTGFTRTILLRTVTSATNQATGATYKFIAGLEANNMVDEERARQLQETARRMELFTGALEFMLAITTAHSAMTELNTSARTKNAAATATQVKAQVALNTAMKANMVGMAVTGIAALITALILLEMRFGTVTKAVGFLRREIQELIDAFNSLRNLGDINLSGFGSGGGGRAKDTFFNRSRGTTYGSGRLA